MRLITPARDELLLTHLSGEEALSSLYAFELEAQAPHHALFSPYDLLGQSVRVEIDLPLVDWLEATVDGRLPRPHARKFCGMISGVGELHEDDHFRYFKFRLEPRLALTKLRADCRIFQEKTVPDILSEILRDFNFQLRLRDGYHHRPYCVQYNESDYTFLSRLAAEEGIFFYFEHEYADQDDKDEHRGERLILTDSIESLPKLLEDGSAEPKQGIHAAADDLPPVSIRYERGEGGTRDELRISKWHKTQKLVSTKSTVRDQSFQLPDQTLEASEEVPEEFRIGDTWHTVRADELELEQFNYPGDYAKQFDGIAPGGGERPDAMRNVFMANARAAKSEIDRWVAQSIRITGESNCLNFLPGHKFCLEQQGFTSGPYFLKSVRHVAQLNADIRSENQSEELRYDNRFECQADVQAYLPCQVTAKPKIFGFQTATVIGPTGTEAHSDKFGRIRVRFNWDRSAKDKDNSCWVRVAQVWAGNRYGAFFWPRVGHEVVIAFEHGDPDRPLVIGSVYNSKNMPPLRLPEWLLSNGIRSCSYKGNPMENYSCVIMHDNRNSEYLQLHSETHECLTSETTKFNFSPGNSVDFRGSGAGGGPADYSSDEEKATRAQPETHQDPRRQLDRVMETLSDEDRECVTRLLGSLGDNEGSGSGGLLVGAAEAVNLFPTRSGKAARAAQLTGVDNQAGHVKVVTGSSHTSFLGDQIDHNYGRKVRISGDIEALLLGLLLWKAPIRGFERGGRLSQHYGNMDNIHFGHQFKAHHGNPRVLNLPTSEFIDQPTYKMPQTKALLVLVKVLSVLIIVIDLALTIAVKHAMETPPSK